MPTATAAHVLPWPSLISPPPIGLEAAGRESPPCASNRLAGRAVIGDLPSRNQRWAGSRPLCSAQCMCISVCISVCISATLCLPPLYFVMLAQPGLAMTADAAPGTHLAAVLPLLVREKEFQLSGTDSGVQHPASAIRGHEHPNVRPATRGRQMAQAAAAADRRVPGDPSAAARSPGSSA